MIIFVAIIFYFVPTAVAIMRWHKNASAIIVLNLLLGWSFIGWVIAFVWACTSNVHESKAVPKKIDPALQWDRSKIYGNDEAEKKFSDKLKNLDLK